MLHRAVSVQLPVEPFQVDVVWATTHAGIAAVAIITAKQWQPTLERVDGQVMRRCPTAIRWEEPCPNMWVIAGSRSKKTASDEFVTPWKRWFPEGDQPGRGTEQLFSGHKTFQSEEPIANPNSGGLDRRPGIAPLRSGPCRPPGSLDRCCAPVIICSEGQ